MAKFYCPFHSTNLTCSPNNHTIFNPNGGSWSSYYSWKVDIKGLEFSDTQFDANGKLKATTMIIDNTSHYIEWSYYEPYWAYENNWKIYIDTSNRIRFKYWFWDAGKGRWYWSTMWDPVDWAWDYDSNRPHNQSNFDGTVLGLTIEKGGKYDFYITRPANNQFKAVLRNVNTGVVQEYSWGGCAWNNNYSDGNGYELHIGETGMSFESAIISGYPYDSNCLHTITINGNTWDGKSSTIKIPIKSDCGYSSTITYDSPFIKKLSIVLPDSIGNVATASTAGTIKWSGGTYNASTKTWTKYFTYDQPYDFPTIADYINKTTIEGSNNFTDNKATMFIGYSTTQGGAPEYDDFGLFRASTDLTLYPCIVLFGESATVTGLTSYDGPATVDGTTFYSTITPMMANSSLKSYILFLFHYNISQFVCVLWKILFCIFLF